MKTISLDDSRWPLLVVRYGFNVDENEFDELLTLLDENVTRGAAQGAKIAIVYDATSGYQGSARVRKKQADWIKKNAAATRERCVGLGFAINSSVGRGVLTAILWLSGMPAPFTVVSSSVEAEAWCLGRLAEHKVSVPPRKARSLRPSESVPPGRKS